jgi:tetratricopeptide (TPR) repeat protein
MTFMLSSSGTCKEIARKKYGVIFFGLPSIFRCFIFLGIILSHAADAQVSKTDSLQIANILSQSHDRLIQHRYQEAVNTAQEALSKSTKLDFKYGLINSLLLIAQAQSALQNYPSSLNHYLQALPEIEKQKDKEKLAWINLKIGELFQGWGVPEKALPYYTIALSFHSDKLTDRYFQLLERVAEVHLSLNQRDQSLNRYQQLLEIMRGKNDALQTKRILDKIASIYTLANDTKNSLACRLQILEINKQLKDTVQTASTLNIIGNGYKDLNDFDKALEYYQAALEINKQAVSMGKNNNNLMSNMINIGIIYQLRGDNRNAIRFFNDALEIKEKKGTPYEIAVMHNYLASLYLAQGNYPEAEDHTQRAIALMAGTDNKRALAASYKRLSDIHEKQGNYEKSLRNYQQYSMLKDSLLYREQLAQEKEKLKEYVIENAEREAKLSLIDYEMKSLELLN